jgi:hypothetical protein
VGERAVGERAVGERVVGERAVVQVWAAAKAWAGEAERPSAAEEEADWWQAFAHQYNSHFRYHWLCRSVPRVLRQTSPKVLALLPALPLGPLASALRT